MIHCVSLLFILSAQLHLGISQNAQEFCEKGVVCGQSANGQLTPIPVLFTFVKAEKNEKLQSNFARVVVSMLQHSTSPLEIFVVSDQHSKPIAERILSESSPDGRSFKLSFVDFDSAVGEFQEEIKLLQRHFSASHSYYNNALFFLSIFFHLILPPSITKVIIFDTDLKFQSDVSLLFALFDDFAEDNLIGLARENQPVYRHLLSSYRSKHPSSSIGSPPPHGATGFNSGVMLMHLERIRSSGEYLKLTQEESYGRLAQEFSFKGHLGDQDFYSLLSFRHPHLFHTLPCQWNRQLCRWWFDHGYGELLEQYHTCEPPIHLFHGNCNTPIP